MSGFMGSSKSPTSLQLIVDEIKFQQGKERQFAALQDAGGYMMARGTTYWTDVFVRHFLFQLERSIDADDLLFFVRKKHVRTSLTMPKFQTEVEVFRKDSKKLPIGDPEVEWKETVFLNLIIHHLEYTLTLAICTRTSPKDLQVLKRHSQKVYASPSRRRMDTKGDLEEMTYPYISFMVDNFNEVYNDMTVRDGEMVCVELVASDRDKGFQAVLFLGSIRYDALKRVYDSRASLGSKMAHKMSFGIFGGGSGRVEYVRLRGPHEKGHAELAVSKPKGAGAETPTSEPGFCITDGMWDSESESDTEDFVFKHHRRLSDPSSNLQNYSHSSGWKSKDKNKARSQSDGLDHCGLAEIEAGDLRDESEGDGSCCSSGAFCPSLPRSQSFRLETIPLNTLTKRRTRPSVGGMAVIIEPSDNIKSNSIACIYDAKHLLKKKLLQNVPNKLCSTGVRIFYMCDLRPKELDDGAYNPLWTMRGYTQSFHMWRESRRASSTPLSAFLTYISLPASLIMNDILDNREEPVLTF